MSEYKGNRSPYRLGWDPKTTPPSFEAVRKALDKIKSLTGQVRLESILTVVSTHITTKEESARLHDAILIKRFWKAYISNNFKDVSEDILAQLQKQADDFPKHKPKKRTRKSPGKPATGNRGTERRAKEKKLVTKTKPTASPATQSRKRFLSYILQKDYPDEHGPVLRALLDAPIAPDPTSLLHKTIRGYQGKKKILHDRLMGSGHMARAIRERFPDKIEGMLDLLEAIEAGTDGIPFSGPPEPTPEQRATDKREAKEKAIADKAIADKAIADKAIADKATNPSPKASPSVQYAGNAELRELRFLQSTVLQIKNAVRPVKGISPTYNDVEWELNLNVAKQRYKKSFEVIATRAVLRMLRARRQQLLDFASKYENTDIAQKVFDHQVMIEIRRLESDPNRAPTSLWRGIYDGVGDLKEFYPNFASDDFPRAILGKTNSADEVRSVVLRDIETRVAKVQKVIDYFYSGKELRPQNVFSFPSIVQQVQRELKVSGYCRNVLALVKPPSTPAEVAALLLTVAAAMASLGQSLWLSLALGTAAGLVDVAVAVEDYELSQAKVAVGLSTKDPHLGWIFLAVVGLGLEGKAIGALIKARRAQKVASLTHETIPALKAMLEFLEPTRNAPEVRKAMDALLLLMEAEHVVQIAKRGRKLNLALFAALPIPIPIPQQGESLLKAFLIRRKGQAKITWQLLRAQKAVNSLSGPQQKALFKAMDSEARSIRRYSDDLVSAVMKKLRGKIQSHPVLKNHRQVLSSTIDNQGLELLDEAQKYLASYRRGLKTGRRAAVYTTKGKLQELVYMEQRAHSLHGRTATSRARKLGDFEDARYFPKVSDAKGELTDGIWLARDRKTGHWVLLQINEFKSVSNKHDLIKKQVSGDVKRLRGTIKVEGIPKTLKYGTDLVHPSEFDRNAKIHFVVGFPRETKGGTKYQPRLLAETQKIVDDLRFEAKMILLNSPLPAGRQFSKSVMRRLFGKVPPEGADDAFARALLESLDEVSKARAPKSPKPTVGEITPNPP